MIVAHDRIPLQIALRLKCSLSSEELSERIVLHLNEVVFRYGLVWRCNPNWQFKYRAPTEPKLA